MRRNRSIVLSYMKLRTLIGVLGMALPAMCYFWCIAYNGAQVLDSLSMHYYTNFRDVFVGILLAVSVFLLTYKGYDILDNVITIVIGVCGIGIAFFPCENKEATYKVSLLMLDNATTNIVHCISAALFFILLAVNSIFLFTKSKKPVEKGSRKYWRNIVFITCGVVILAALAVMAAVSIWASQDFRDRTHVILIVETVMLASFGVSWLVKGGALLGDRKSETGEA